MKSELIEIQTGILEFEKSVNEFLKNKKESDIIYTKYETTYSPYITYRVFFIYKDENDILENKETI